MTALQTAYLLLAVFAFSGVFGFLLLLDPEAFKRWLPNLNKPAWKIISITVGIFLLVVCGSSMWTAIQIGSSI